MECILVSDTGSGEIEQYKVAKSMEKLIKKNKRIKFIVATGDNIYEDGCTSVKDEQFNTKFHEPYKNINLPFYLCLGNHDYNLGLNAAKVQIDYTFSELNKNNKWNMPNKWYTISYPNIDIVFIDTNFYWLSQSVIQKQLNDTIKSLNKNKNKWKILCGHHTWRSVGGHGSAENQHESFMNSLFTFTVVKKFKSIIFLHFLIGANGSLIFNVWPILLIIISNLLYFFFIFFFKTIKSLSLDKSKMYPEHFLFKDLRV